MNAPPPYVMLPQYGVVQAPPYRRNVPRYHSGPKRSCCGSCLRLICCCYCILVLFLILLSILTFYFYTAFQPQIPSYNFMGINVKAFNVMPDFSLKTELIVTVKAENPNNHIGFIYGRDSYVIVDYKDSNLCAGKLPFFHQGHRNTTVMQIDLNGKSEFGSGLQEALEDSKKKGKIPLLVRVKVPVNIVLVELPLRTLNVFVNCSLVVDNLAPNKPIKILSKTMTYDVQI